ncbi:MAG: NAD(P)/FAD-dependent oxidoreductase [Candidatus Promineifilaceae bacterium]
MDYDVIISGGSFAGLAAAAQLRGKRVLLVEPNPIGKVQTSACGTLLDVLEVTGTMDSLLQIHNHFVFHAPQRSYEMSLPYDFCTFDYEIFCQRLLAQSEVEILRASVKGHQGHLVLTTRGDFEACALIDATGWRAALATNGQQRAQAYKGRSFGIETTVPVQRAGLHFWYQPERLLTKGIAWLFPTGSTSRAGIGSYLGKTRLKDDLVNWLHVDFAQSLDGVHGGYFPYSRRPATTGVVFRVGDSAGQCLPLTGEGIRPALYFGAKAGQLARAVIDGEMRESEALASYHSYVNSHALIYRFLFFAQMSLTNVPAAWVENLSSQIQRRNVFRFLMRHYRSVMEPSLLSGTNVNGRAYLPVNLARADLYARKR